MTTRRRTTCFILSAFVLASCSITDMDPPRRIVRVKALAAPSLREHNAEWNRDIRALIESASRYFEREFGIRFATESAAAWPEHEHSPSTPAMLLRLQRELPSASDSNNHDVVVLVTAQRLNRYVPEGRPRVDRIGDCKQGLGRYVVTTMSRSGRRRGTGGLADDTVALIHEFAHLFGAEHVRDTHSIMHENFDYRTEFDSKNRAVILKNRDCPFARATESSSTGVPQ